MIELRSPHLSLVVNVERGGAVARFDGLRDGHKIPLWQPGGALPACFAMVPFVGRLPQGKLSFGGHTWSIDPNHPSHTLPIHGYAWLAPWRICSRNERALRIAYDGCCDDWPWHYQVQQHFELLGHGLTITLELSNRDTRTMPWSMGLHALLHRGGGSRVRLPIVTAWEMSAAGIPIREHRDTMGLASGMPIGPQALDQVFSGWQGEAVVDWPNSASQIKVRNTGMSNCTLWAPSGEDFFGLEPLSDIPGRFAQLESGQSVQLRSHWQWSG